MVKLGGGTMKINRRNLLSRLGASPAIFSGSAAGGASNQKNQNAAHPATEIKFEGLNPQGMPPAIEQSIHVVVVGGQTNPYDQVANMSDSRSVSIDQWM